MWSRVCGFCGSLHIFAAVSESVGRFLAILNLEGMKVPGWWHRCYILLQFSPRCVFSLEHLRWTSMSKGLSTLFSSLITHVRCILEIYDSISKFSKQVLIYSTSAIIRKFQSPADSLQAHFRFKSRLGGCTYSGHFRKIGLSSLTRCEVQNFLHKSNISTN